MNSKNSMAKAAGETLHGISEKDVTGASNYNSSILEDLLFLSPSERARMEPGERVVLEEYLIERKLV